MNKKEFKMDSKTTLKRITKQEAKKVFDSGAPIWLEPCKLEPSSEIGLRVLYREQLRKTTYRWDSVRTTFDYYYACNELGYYPAYYVKKEEE